MATLAKCNLVVQDTAGNIVNGATISVISEVTGLPATVYSDRSGSSSLGSSYVAADGADAGFFANDGVYKITATKGGFSRTWRYVGVSLASEAYVEGGQINIANGQSGGSAAPSPSIRLGAYFDNAGAVSISHIDVYNGAYGFGIASGTFAYIAASGGLHKFYTGADLTAANFAFSIGAYNAAATSQTTGAVNIQGGLGVTGAAHIGAGSGATPQIVSYGRIKINGNAGDASAVLELQNNAGNISYIYCNSSGQLQLTPYANATIFAGDFYAGGLFNIGSHLQRQVPVTETGATHTVAPTTSYLICNRAGTVTVTLPAAGSFPGRELYIKTIQAQTVVSASSNVVPVTDTAAGTAILPATEGAWALLVSDGTNWIIVAQAVS